MFLWKQKPIFTCILWVSPAIRDMNRVENVDRNFLKERMDRKYDFSLYPRDR